MNKIFGDSNAMKYKNSKFLLIGLLVLSIIISISAINATDDNTSTNMIKQHDDIFTINTQTNKDTITQQQNNIKSTKKVENKNNKEAKISNSKENITKTTKKATHTVNNYQELYNKIEEIKTSSDNTTINLNPGNYTITTQITWGSTDQQAKTMTINENGQTIDGENIKQFIIVENGYTLNLQNIIIKQCFTTALGAGIYNKGNTSIINSTFTENNETIGGGGGNL